MGDVGDEEGVVVEVDDGVGGVLLLLLLLPLPPPVPLPP